MSTSKETSIPECSFTTKIYFSTVMVRIYMPIHIVLGFFFSEYMLFTRGKEINQA